jgi:hypothetical protein
LPEGSVRAVIALLLILLFFISAIFLYADVGRRETDRVLKGIDAARLASIPTDSIRSLESVGSGESKTFNVVLLGADKNQESRDLAKQLVTTVSTLVVAVAAFYFGTSSVPQVAGAHDSVPAPGGPASGSSSQVVTTGQAVEAPADSRPDEAPA